MTISETHHAAEFIASEANGARSRERVTVESGQNLKAGAVLGLITASSTYAAYDNGAADGTETAAAILLDDVDASAADVDGVAVVRDAEVKRALLVFDAGQNQAAQDAAIVDLAALGLVAR